MRAGGHCHPLCGIVSPALLCQHVWGQVLYSLPPTFQLIQVKSGLCPAFTQPPRSLALGGRRTRGNSRYSSTHFPVSSSALSLSRREKAVYQPVNTRVALIKSSKLKAKKVCTKTFRVLTVCFHGNKDEQNSSLVGWETTF